MKGLVVEGFTSAQTKIKNFKTFSPRSSRDEDGGKPAGSLGCELQLCQHHQ